MAHILVIDNDELQLDLVVQALRVEGHDVLAINDDSAALEVIKKFAFDLLLCDVHIGTASGFGLRKQIIAMGNNIPMLFMSGSPGLSGAISATTNQVVVLQKPFTSKGLHAAVNKALLRKTTRQSRSVPRRNTTKDILN